MYVWPEQGASGALSATHKDSQRFVDFLWEELGQVLLQGRPAHVASVHSCASGGGGGGDEGGGATGERPMVSGVTRQRQESGGQHLTCPQSCPTPAVHHTDTHTHT
jgi:hypothetical protein